jgi:hypothetical protein
MSRTVDLVIVGMTAAARDAAIEAARRGRRVLVVGESRDNAYLTQLRRSLEVAGDGCRRRVSMLTGVEVVSVDGTTAVEVVLLRHVKTGRLTGINTSAVLATTDLASGVVARPLRSRVLKSHSR